MKYHYLTGVQKRWSFERLFNLLAIAGWIALTVLIIGTMVFNGQLTTKVLMR